MTVTGDVLNSLSFYISADAKDFFIARYKLLIENGADIDAKDNLGRTALMGVAQNKTMRELAYFVEKGADVNAKDNEGKTVLMYVGGAQMMQKAKYLVERGADIHAKNNEGKTAAMIAVENFNFGFVKYYIERGENLRGSCYLSNPAKCGCGKKCDMNNNRGNSSDIGYLIREGVIVAADTVNYPVCLCANEANPEPVMLPVEKDMNVRMLSRFCEGCGYDEGY